MSSGYIVYVDRIVPLVQRIKFDFFGHDMVVLHEREIRKSAPPFDMLLRPDVRQRFMNRIDAVFAEPFDVVATAIDKNEFKAAVGAAVSPYNVALEDGLERVFVHLQQCGLPRKPTVVVFESRGKREDRELEEEFDRIMATTTVSGMADSFRFVIASKQANSSGLQLADLVARPIGAHLLKPEQPNRAWDRIADHMSESTSGSLSDRGLRVHPGKREPPA